MRNIAEDASLSRKEKVSSTRDERTGSMARSKFGQACSLSEPSGEVGLFQLMDQ